MMYTRHAIKRMKERGISPKAIETLCSYGVEHHDKRGATMITLMKQSLDAIKQNESANLFRYFKEKNIYVIEKDGLIITAGHRLKKINRH